jgi:phosphoribosylpyrophosphate synthetase
MATDNNDADGQNALTVQRVPSKPSCRDHNVVVTDQGYETVDDHHIAHIAAFVCCQRGFSKLTSKA